MDRQLAKALDRVSGDIGCLNTRDIPATLISTVGSHCEVWRTIGAIVEPETRTTLDLVIKKFRVPCSFREIRIFQKEFRILKSTLGTMVPDAVYVHTAVDGQPSVVAVAATFTPWFNIANPANEVEAVPLLKRLVKARRQLRRFVGAARSWYSDPDPKVIDLYGSDNLILDKNYNVRYVDSFGVFFYEDLLHLIEEVDDELRYKIEVSRQRIDYLDFLVRQSGG